MEGGLFFGSHLPLGIRCFADSGRAETSVCGESRPGSIADDERIAAVHGSVGIHIRAEDRPISGLPGTVACLLRIAGVHSPVAIRIADQHAHRGGCGAGVVLRIEQLPRVTLRS